MLAFQEAVPEDTTTTLRTVKSLTRLGALRSDKKENRNGRQGGLTEDQSLTQIFLLLAFNIKIPDILLRNTI